MKWRTIFLATVGTILLSTSALKLIAVQNPLEVLDQRDRIFDFLSMRQLLFIVSLAELAVALSIFVAASQRTAILLTIWLNAGFLVYRIGLWLTRDFKPCKCFGGAISWIGLSDDVLEIISKILLGYMLAGSVWFLMQRKEENDVIDVSQEGYGKT